MEFGDSFSGLHIGPPYFGVVPEGQWSGGGGELASEVSLGLQASRGSPSLFGEPPLTVEILTTLLFNLGKIRKNQKPPNPSRVGLQEYR